MKTGGVVVVVVVAECRNNGCLRMHKIANMGDFQIRMPKSIK